MFYLCISSTSSWLDSTDPVSKYSSVSAIFCLSSVSARSGQLAHMSDSILNTVINVPVLMTGGITTSSCCRLVSRSLLAISCRRAGSFWKLSTSLENAKQTHSTLFLSCCVSRLASSDKSFTTYWNSSEVRFRQQLAVTERALRCAFMEKKSRYVRQADTPLWIHKENVDCDVKPLWVLELTACKMALECLLDSMSKAVNDCSATSMHWITWSFWRKTGTASTTTAEERGKASIMYVRARQA